MTHDAAPPLSGHPLAPPGAAFVMVEWADDGESSAEHPVAPLHVHHEGEEGWYVLQGTLGVRLADRIVEVPAGSAVMAPRGTPHTFWNAGSGPVRYVLVMTPEILRLIDRLHTLPRRDPKTLEAHFREHGSELLDL